MIWRPSGNLLCNNDRVMLVYATKVLGEYGVEAMMAKSANSTESRPGALRRLRSCRAAWG